MCQACGRKWALSLGRAEYGTDKDGNSIGATPALGLSRIKLNLSVNPA